MKYVIAIPLSVWPPRIKPTVYIPGAMIGHHFYKKVFYGALRLPQVVKVGDSKVISVKIDHSWKEIGYGELEALKSRMLKEGAEYPIYMESNNPEVINSTGSIITLALAESLRVPRRKIDVYIESELLASGVTLGSERAQRRRVGYEELIFDWPVTFDKSGTHEVKFVFRVISDGDDGVRSLSVCETPIHIVKVVAIAGLTSRETVWGSLIAGGISAGWFIVQAVTKILGR